MLHQNDGARTKFLRASVMIAVGIWFLLATPALAQGGTDAHVSSAIEQYFLKPDVVTPLVAPMILMCGGLVSFFAFLAWVFMRLPQE